MIISSFKNTFFIKFDKSKSNSNSLGFLRDKLQKEYTKYKIDGIILLKDIKIDDLENNKLFLKISYDLYNIDLTKAEVSGNGLACLAKFINHVFKFDKNFNNIYFTFYNISFSREFYLKYKQKLYFVAFDSNKFELKENIFDNCYYVNVGNSHVICIENNFIKTSFIINFLRDLYKKMYEILNFESNVHLIFKRNNSLYIYSYERGVGFTKSCGSGSVASFYLLNKLKIINNNKIILKSPGGNIKLYKESNFYYLISKPVILRKIKL